MLFYRWWNGFDIQTHLTWARDRMVEIHFWMMGVLFEPHYSYPRVVLTKLFTLVSVFDDFYDNYSTTEESNMFTTAINRLTFAPILTDFNHMICKHICTVIGLKTTGGTSMQLSKPQHT